jgi:uncharacterized protein YbaP (TraB family)
MKFSFLYSLLLLIPSFVQAQTTEKSLFWEITGNGLQDTSYLYGTMHVQDKRVFDFKPGVLESFDKCNLYAMEIDADSVNQMALMNLLWMKDDVSIKDLLTKKQYNFLDEYFRDSIGQSIFLFNRMLPIMTTQMIFSNEISSDMELALDLHFAAMAKEQKKKVVGLEKTEEQIAALDGIPYKYQAELLYETAMEKSNGENDESIAELMSAYVAGDLELMLQLTNEENSEDKEMQALFEKLLIVNRNKTMVERSIPLITASKSFIAVGAAHLGGVNGVIQLLRNEGYKVEAK